MFTHRDANGNSKKLKSVHLQLDGERPHARLELITSKDTLYKKKGIRLHNTKEVSVEWVNNSTLRRLYFIVNMREEDKQTGDYKRDQLKPQLHGTVSLVKRNR